MGKGTDILIKRIEEVAEQNGRCFRKVGDSYVTYDKYDGCDEFYHWSLKEILWWEKTYRKLGLKK